MNEMTLLLGVDGGGTRCRARLTTWSGKILGESVAGPANIRLGIEQSFTALLEATADCLQQAGRRIREDLCIDTKLDVKAGAAAMAQLLARKRRPRAVFCSADAIAVGALFECQRHKLDVPGDIAIAGFDDLDLAGQVVPPLTTIRVLRYELGRRAGELICKRLGDEPIATPIVDVGFEFVPRASA